jgi:dihydrofolate reductase
MALKVTAYFGASLDGFIAKKDGSIDWLNEIGSLAPEGEECGFQVFMESVDIMVMGRKTYEQVRGFGPWPYGDTPVIVLSHNAIAFPPNTPETVSHSSDSPENLCARLKESGVEHVYVDGGATTRGFLAAGLIDEVIVTVVPVILGGGISPFGELETEIVLKPMGSKVFDFGFVQMRYSVKAE